MENDFDSREPTILQKESIELVVQTGDAAGETAGDPVDSAHSSESSGSCESLKPAESEGHAKPVQVDESSGCEAEKDPCDAVLVADGYRILNQIGAGAMGAVYKVIDQQTGKVHALKFMRPELVTDRKMLKRFAQETEAASSLTHPNIAAVYARGSLASGAPYIVMDYVEGTTLADLLEKEERLNSERAIALFIQISAALAHAHRKGVVHRDVKPSNIMLGDRADSFDQVKLVDFGIAKLITASGAEVNNVTQTAQVVGSPSYMSPEQCLGLPLDARSDIYSFGCVMYRTLSGRLPFAGANAIQTITQQIREKTPPLKLDGDRSASGRRLVMIIERALQKDPGKRYQSMDQLHLDLLRVQSGRNPRFVSLARASRAAMALAASVALVSCVNWMYGLKSEVPQSIEHYEPVVQPSAQTAAPIEIRNTHSRLLYRSKSAKTLCAALREAADKKVNLSGANFAACNFISDDGRLSPVVVKGANLSNADFTGSTFQNVVFSDCNLDGANFTAISAPGGTQPISPPFMKNCSLRRAKMRAAEEVSSCFVNCFLTDVDFTGARCDGAKFTHCDLSGTGFSGAELANAEFVDDNLSRANLRGAEYSNLLFQRCDLRHAAIDTNWKYDNCLSIAKCQCDPAFQYIYDHSNQSEEHH